VSLTCITRILFIGKLNISMNDVFRDLKPENILLINNQDLT